MAQSSNAKASLFYRLKSAIRLIASISLFFIEIAGAFVLLVALLLLYPLAQAENKRCRILRS